MTDAPSNESMTRMEAYLATKDSKTYNPYYNGKMSYTLHGQSWESYVAEAFPDIKEQTTSENIFKGAIDLYAENLVPVPDQLRGFSNVVVPLLSRGECPVVVDSAGTPHFPEHYEMMSDGQYTVAAIFTRNLEKMEDYITFAYTDGRTRLFAKDVPEDFSKATLEGFHFVEETGGNTLFRFALDDKGFGASLAALQDRVNHSIIDQTVVAEMYARPFWYLLNVSMPPKNPYLPQGTSTSDEELNEHKGTGSSARIFTTSGQGPFGQLTPPTIADMIGYHDSILDKVSQGTGIPQFYFKPGSGTPPTGVALKVLSKRFNNKIARMREDIEPVLEELASLLKVEKTATEKDAKGNETPAYEFWNTSDDLLQESLDAHGISLSQMGYPLEYIAEVVTPGVDLADYTPDTVPGQNPPAPTGPPVPPGQQQAATDMTATGQKGLPATPGQVQAYAQNPGQRAAVKA